MKQAETPRRVAKSRILSLERGLEFLVVLNRHNGLSANKMAALTNRSRATAHRTLESLRDQGFLWKDTRSGAYWLESRVLSLSAGYHNEQWIVEHAIPCIEELSRTILWPVRVGTPAGTSMLLRASTDFESPLATEKNLPGNRVSIFESAGGRVVLAFSPPQQRDLFFDLAQWPRKGRTAIRQSIEQRLSVVRARGYDIAERHGICTLAVPILVGTRPIACLGMRYYASAMTEAKAAKDYFELLQQASSRIAIGIGE